MNPTKKRLTKREVKKRAYFAIGQMLEHEADSTEIFDNQNLDEGEVLMLVQAMRDIAAELIAKGVR